jgi:hypothetical protein
VEKGDDLKLPPGDSRTGLLLRKYLLQKKNGKSLSAKI